MYKQIIRLKITKTRIFDGLCIINLWLTNTVGGVYDVSYSLLVVFS